MTKAKIQHQNSYLAGYGMIFLRTVNLKETQLDLLPMAFLSLRERGTMVLPILCVMMSVVANVGAAGAVELEYKPNLPQFGGLNGQNLTILQFEKQMVDSRVAKEEALKREMDRLENKVESTPTDQLVSSLTRSLNSKVASRITDDILNGDSTAQEFFLGDVAIRYVRNDDGMITVTIDDGTGETIISVPGVVPDAIE